MSLSSIDCMVYLPLYCFWNCHSKDSLPVYQHMALSDIKVKFVFTMCWAKSKTNSKILVFFPVQVQVWKFRIPHLLCLYRSFHKIFLGPGKLLEKLSPRLQSIYIKQILVKHNFHSNCIHCPKPSNLSLPLQILFFTITYSCPYHYNLLWIW